MAWVCVEPKTLNSVQTLLTDWAIRPRVQLALRANFVQLLHFHLFALCSRLISLFALVSLHIYFKRSLEQVITLVAEWINTYRIHHWRIFKSSYRKMTWVEFEPTTTEFRSEALTDWAIIPWVQLVLRANFVQLLQFHLFFQCWRCISVFGFVNAQISVKRSLVQGITLVAEWIDTYAIHSWSIFRSSYIKLVWMGFELINMVFTTEAILEVAIESWLKWDLTPRPLIFVQTLQPTYLTGHEFNSLSEPSLYCFSNFISLFSVHISFRSLPSSVATFALSEVSQR